MGMIISSKDKQKFFDNKETINIGTNPNCDFVVNLGFDLLLSVQYDSVDNVCYVLNNFNSEKILFRGQPLPHRIKVEKLCKLMIQDTDEFITVKVAENAPVGVSIQEKAASASVANGRNSQSTMTMDMIAEEDLNEADIKSLYGSHISSATKIKLEKRKADIELRRVSILKEIGFAIENLKGKLKLNERILKIANFGIFLVPLLTGMAVSGYFKEMTVYSTGTTQGMPLHMRIILVCATCIIFASIALKQGMYLYIQNKITQRVSSLSRTLEQGFIFCAMSAYFIMITILIVLYLNPDIIVIPLPLALTAIFGIILSMVTAIFCGYIKHHTSEIGVTLDRHESREDFKKVIQDYQQWITLYINNLSKNKLQYIKNKIFNLQIKSAGEVVLGILTAPFLAYGVSNTLAMCFPEAAGWIRISGLRFSPIFLTLATFLIIFAFFSLVSAFTATKRIQASEVITKDGFSNFHYHGVDIYGTEGIKKLKSDSTKSMIIALTIIFIEFTMNISYFITEIGGDWEGLFLSAIAASVPTALLIAETFMLSKTQFEIFVHEQILAKFDKDF